MATQAEGAEPPPAPPISATAALGKGAGKHAWLALLLLTAVYLVSFMDRQILALLVEPIRADLALGDTTIGTIQGLTFGVIFTLCAIPMGWLADRVPRRKLVSGAVIAWSVLTGLCAFVTSAPQLFLARTGVAIGEAALGPSAAPLIRELFPRHQAARALSVYSLGIPLGGGLAVFLGAVLLPAVGHWDLSAWPLLAALKPWQLTFLLLALPGLALGLLIPLIREPARPAAGEPGGAASLGEAARFFAVHWRTFVGFGLPGIGAMMLTFGIQFWIPAALGRTYGLSPEAVAPYLKTWGLMAMGLGVLGTLTGGYVADALRQRHVDGYVRLAAIAMAVIAGSYAGFLYAPTPQLALLALVPAAFTIALPPVAATAGAMELIPGSMRSVLFAAWMLFVSLIGASSGPPLIGFLTEHVFARPDALREAIAVTAAGSAVLAVPLLIAVRAPYRSTQAAAAAYVSPPRMDNPA